jgi:acetyl-CoA decarbonylase/synthase complex subunit gamma
MNYTIEPGVYAMGRPDERSPVLVTANYKLSFDKLRNELTGRNVWILVLDTKGVNVWCSAGKGTFGTTELVDRVESTGLANLISHRELILPQLAGPGVAAHEVKKKSGFRVIYGPIRASDLPAFLDSGLKATPEMRLKTFTLWERLVLVPVELANVMKAGLMIFPVMFLLAYLGKLGEGTLSALNHGLFSVLALLMAIVAGAVLTPLLLPWLPGRAFSVKGLTLGLLADLILVTLRLNELVPRTGWIEMLAWLLLIPAMSTYLAMNFTGSSTYTSLSGVRREMRWALPAQIAAGSLGLILWIGSQFLV